MRRFHGCTAGAALGLCCVALPTPALAAPSAPGALPAGLVWVSRGPQDDASTLHRVTAAGTVTRTPLGYAVNAIGCAADGSVFGLAATRAGRKLRPGPHVVRVDAAGRVTDLGAVRAAGQPLADGYGGTVVGRDGGIQLLVGTASAIRAVQVTPGAPRLLPARRLPALPYVGDWVLDPRSGDLLTVAARAGRAQLVRVAPGAAKAVMTPLPAVVPGRSAYGGLALHPDGTLTALFNQAAGPGAGQGTGRAPGGSALFRIPLAHPERAAKVMDLGAITSSDATTCPVPAPPLPAPVVPAPVPFVPAPVVPSPAAAAPAASLPVVAASPPVAVIAGEPVVPAPVVVSTAAPVPVQVLPPAAKPGPRKATPSTPPPTVTPPPAATPPPTAAPVPVAAPARKLVPPPAPAAVAAAARSPIGKRFIPVIGGFMIAAVAMTRLFRRRRR